MDVGRREDQLLDKIAELTKKRDKTLSTLDAFRISWPEAAEVMEFLIVILK